MSVVGTFEVQLEPQADPERPAGRMLITKHYSGGLEGSGLGQMISKRTEGGASAYFAVEEFSGTLEGKSGAFTLLHRGYMSAQGATLEVDILEGSGSGQLVGISGTLVITQEDGGHQYALNYAMSE